MLLFVQINASVCACALRMPPPLFFSSSFKGFGAEFWIVDLFCLVFSVAVCTVLGGIIECE